MNRRGFLQSVLAAGVAPAFVGSGILMPVRKLITAPDIITPKSIEFELGEWSGVTIYSSPIAREVFAKALFAECQKSSSMLERFK